MNQKLYSLFYWLLIFVGAPTYAQTLQDHRSLLIMTSESSLAQRLPAPWFISHFSSNSERKIRRADGAVLMEIRDSVHSAYDDSTSYNLGRFFRARNNRLSLIANWATIAGTIWSVGIDSGHSSQKIKLQGSLFLGATSSWQTNRNQVITLGFGSWHGGGVRESPCVDEYDRRYYCPTLIAWSDRIEIRSGAQWYLDIRLTQKF